MTLAEQLRDALTESAAELSAPELLPTRLARAAARVLPVDGAGISLFFAHDRRLPLGASDPVAGEVERLQFTIGEGPCLAAHAEGRPVVADKGSIATRWPAFYDALVARTPVRGSISLPLGGGLGGIGALDLYIVPPRGVGDLGLQDALAVADEVAATLEAQSRATQRSGDAPAWVDAPATERRAIVWQAMGYLNAGLRMDSEDALAVLRAYAYAEGGDLDDVALEVVEGRLPLERLALESDTPQ
ncbi:hypothetical protein [Blastococcus sp. URHD0036]|uniref:hypothetical protein n=1 Tax=Blastococcus sp. URHD0036 TaxID=1380356 RepID=UPI000496CB50|nr:hypothetical protein [Blastococcus sp. URHD0036]